MTPVPMADFRMILRDSPARALALWTEGMAVAASATDTGATLSGLASADLSGRRMQILPEIAAQTGAYHLPVALIRPLRMEPGWLGRSMAPPQGNPMAAIGAALSLIAMAQGLGGHGPVAAVLSHCPTGGVRVAV